MQGEHERMDMERQAKFFDTNYRNGGGSGAGSRVASTVVYRNVIESFIKLNDVHTVLDLGCGDWQFSKLIPWDDYDISYLGLDVSPFIIETNQARFGSEHRQFKVIRKPSEIFDFGHFDLVISKDCLQHLPNHVVNEYLDVFAAVARYALITNDAFTSGVVIEDINRDDIFRPIDIRRPPFSRNSTIIAEYTNFFGQYFFAKHVHLLIGQSER